MELLLKRKFKKKDYTIGELTYNGEFICDTLEDQDRELKDSMSLEEIRKIKKPSLTAIPTGTYKITLDIISPKFSKYPFYMGVCKGKLPRLQNVKGFDGILIHCGEGPNGARFTSGCIIIGLNTIKGGLTKSKECFEKVYKILKNAYEDKEELYINIV